MPYDRKPEVEALLDAEDRALGDVWRQMQNGLSIDQIASERGVQTGTIYALKRTIGILLDGDIPKSPVVAEHNARRIRTWLREKTMSSELRGQLTDQLRALEANANNPNAVEEELAERIKTTRDAEAHGLPGIYVYTLPHYLKYRVDSETRKTLLKVGYSSTNAPYRVKTQARQTALPEDPILLRIYPTAAESASETEKRIHEWLRKADHCAPPSKLAGSEWFITSTKFLDHIATHLGLEVRVVNPELEVGED
jgi:hypothetical protein